MLSRLVFTAPRLALNLTPRILHYSTKNTSTYREMTKGGFKVSQNTGFGLRPGPTTEKTSHFGAVAFAGASAIGIAALIYYSLKNSSMVRHSALSNAIRENIATTYSYLLCSATITTLSAVAASRPRILYQFVKNYRLTSFFLIGFFFSKTGYKCYDIPFDDTDTKHGAWLIHYAVVGAALAPLCRLGGTVLIRTAWYTAGMVAGLSAAGITAPSQKFLKRSAPVGMALGVAFMANISCFFLPKSTALAANPASVAVYGCLLFISILLLQDTQRVAKVAEGYAKRAMQAKKRLRSFDPINVYLSIYIFPPNNKGSKATGKK